MGTTEVMLWCHVSVWVGEWRLVGQGLHHTSFTCTIHTSLTAPAHLLFPSLPGPVVGEMLSAARFAAVGMVGRPLTHVVRDAFCVGDEGIAEVREQHRYPPTALCCKGVRRSCHGRSGSVTGDYADRDLDNPRNLPTLCAV